MLPTFRPISGSLKPRWHSRVELSSIPSFKQSDARSICLNRAGLSDVGFRIEGFTLIGKSSSKQNKDIPISNQSNGESSKVGLQSLDFRFSDDRPTWTLPGLPQESLQFNENLLPPLASQAWNAKRPYKGVCSDGVSNSSPSGLHRHLRKLEPQCAPGKSSFAKKRAQLDIHGLVTSQI